ncbi:MAG: 50S ribosomal protein L11 methyltransferase [Rikenellaceae bacterium]|nr:50S ribosomal protein L11 methyltransferase [Rikenellaceae bacterium]
MNYKEFTVKISSDAVENAGEILIAELADFDFESFAEDEYELKAYIPVAHYKVQERSIINFLSVNGYEYKITEINDDVNWNAEWESNFDPIDVNGQCYIRAPFHNDVKGCKYIVTIMPKMSFGTGHHATTHLMIEGIMDSDIKNRSGLDMGSGTGVLAILAVKAGAMWMDAIDIDEWAYENCKENIELNRTSENINVFLGDAGLLAEPGKYDFILANINRNILLADMDKYSVSIKPGGELFLSGFLDIDSEVIRKKAEENGFVFVDEKHRNGWCMLKFKKTI